MVKTLEVNERERGEYDFHVGERPGVATSPMRSIKGQQVEYRRQVYGACTWIQ